MTEDKIKDLLQEADHEAGPPARVCVNLSAIRGRAHRRRFESFAGPLAAAAVILIAVGLWNSVSKTTVTTRERERIAALETRISQLHARTDAALNLIHEVLEAERREQRLEVLQAQLAGIPDPLEDMQRQVDKTAFILVYQADRMYRELNQTDSAVETYKRIIKLFPENQWAAVARQRLAEIRGRKSNETDLQGDSKWKAQSVSSSC